MSKRELVSRRRIGAGPTRRDFMRTAAGIAAGAAVGGLALPAVVRAEDKIEGELLVETFGGEYSDAVQKYVVAPFEAKYPVKVKLANFGSSSEQLAKIQAGNARVDVSWFGDSRVYLAIKSSAILPLRLENIPNFGQQHEKFQHPAYEVGDGRNYSSAMVWGDRAIAYNSDKIATRPVSWDALLDPQWKGRVALKGSSSAMVQIGALMTGQDFNAIKDLDAIEKKLKALKPNLLKYWGSGSELTQLFATGEVWIADFWRGRVNKLKEDGTPMGYVVPKEGAPSWVDCVVVPRTCANRRAAEAFIDMSLDPEVQKNFVTKGINYAPSNVHTQLSDAERERLGAWPAIFDSAVFVDAAYQATHIDEWNQMANRVKA
ncbi:spermidine/putrescine transport system substrate-binding protein [Tistlia consotensis]|uniref:Spermidine/putrescine transport system substrate-binding protein n=1 Tax=Tistlia consotensis USBA 355 TaxID=560819 RepID=A0A1Y6B870_9PROT|nr:extracellular solute-binding protein [Tistlia consotensis]SME98013.1 spermidine/putrescine transport system substrate-binding protein [Tistlia consotensis USBA 355]SNR57402.1 spermidine/putrescine transport system substrate-binding protein [Tistlia consotensis]